MKKLLVCLMLLSLSLPCFAAVDTDIFDFFGPLPYNGSTLDKLTVSVYTYKDMDISSSTFFDTNLFFIGVPLGLADIRFEGYIPNGSDPFLKLSTVFPFWIASLQAGMSFDTGSDYKELNLDLIFGNPLFNWGVGLQNDIGPTSDTYPTLKIAKDIDLGVGNVEGKLTVTKYPSDTELDIMCKARLKVIPAYIGMSNATVGSSSFTAVMIGAYLTM